ncbi:MAG TPA: hypothetical protein VG407_04055 [Caulobacteraceae bacterium]|jgi:hypothetical protein|nr:hypothetical protein [Caulobacteraceae bacterium]
MRLVVALLLSVIVYAVTALAGLWTVAEIYALPPGTSVTDPAMVRAVLSCAPVTAKLLIMAAWVVSSLLTCIVAARWGGGPRMAWVGGLVALAGGVWMLAQTTQPIWMVIAAIAIPLVIAAALGLRKPPRRAEA